MRLFRQVAAVLRPQTKSLLVGEFAERFERAEGLRKVCEAADEEEGAEGAFACVNCARRVQGGCWRWI